MCQRADDRGLPGRNTDRGEVRTRENFRPWEQVRKPAYRRRKGPAKRLYQTSGTGTSINRGKLLPENNPYSQLESVPHTGYPETWPLGQHFCKPCVLRQMAADVDHVRFEIEHSAHALNNLH